MKFGTYLSIVLTLLVLGLIVIDPVLFLVDKWDVHTLLKYVTRRPEVVFFGNSIEYSPSPCDRDRRTISEFTGEMLGQPVFPFSHAAFSPIVYRKAVRLLRPLNGKVKRVVVPLNLGSFSDAFLTPPYYFFRKQLAFDLLDFRFDPALYYRVRYEDLVFNLSREWLQKPVYDHVIRLGKIKEVRRRIRDIRPIGCNEGYEAQRELIGLQYSYHFGNVVTPDHFMIGQTQQTLDSLAEDGLRAVVYLSPVNLEAIRMVGGQALHARVLENLTVIRTVAAQRRWPLIDLSSVLSDAEFGDRHCACGHLKEAGRRKVARAVAGRLIALEHEARPGLPSASVALGREARKR